MFSEDFVFGFYELLWIPLNYIVCSGRGRPTDYTIFIINEDHFIFHQKRLRERVFFRNYSPIIFGDILPVDNFGFGEKSKSSTINIWLLDLYFEHFRVSEDLGELTFRDFRVVHRVTTIIRMYLYYYIQIDHFVRSMDSSLP